MSSHSASTITTVEDDIISLFEINDNKVETSKVCKSNVINSLSAGLILFSESEARLNINHVLANTSGPVLFTEGITDEIILETAWQKLYPDEDRPFEIQNAFSCGFLRNLVNTDGIYQNSSNRRFFALFDFDEAYNDWVQLGDIIETDYHKCLAKQHRRYNCISLLLPVPATGIIKEQVINPANVSDYGNRSLLTIELLFYGIDGLDSYFVDDTKRPPGTWKKFVADNKKADFAKNVIPSLAAEHFDIFRPMFEFIKSKCELN